MEQQVSGEEYRQMSVSSRPPSSRRKHAVRVPLVWLIVVLVVGVLCFFIGDSYGKDHAPKSAALATTRSGAFGGRFGGAGPTLRAFGTVSSISSTSIAIANQRTGSNVTYNITSSTQITDNSQTVSYTDIQTGDSVIITLASASSTNASSIVVNPSFGGSASGPTLNISSGTN